MSKAHEVVDRGDHWILPLQGRLVTRCFVDNAFGIDFWLKDDEYTVRIGEPFLYIESERQHSISPEEPTTLCPVLSILHKEVNSIRAYKTGSLCISFSDGSYLSVDASPDYEAWEISGSNGLEIISMPGGDLAIWTPGGIRPT